MSNFGDTPVTLRPKANAGDVDLLASGVVRMMQGDEEYPLPGVEFCAQPSPRAGMRHFGPDPGSPIVGALDTRGAVDPGKGGGTPDPRPLPQDWAVPRDWAPAAPPAPAEPTEPEGEPICAVLF